MLSALQLAASSKSKPPVCPWTVPGGVVLEKTAADLAAMPQVIERPDTGCGGMVAAVVVAALALGLSYPLIVASS